MELQAIIRAALVKVLTTIQTSSGKALPDLTDSLKPLNDLEDFNSEVWPIASGMLQVELNIQIPGKVNVFQDPATSKALTIAQIVQRIQTNYKVWTVALPAVPSVGK